MHYCQDCGGANAANATTCRICGHLIVGERGGPPCQSCGAPTVEGGKFCSLCGTATVAAPAAALAGVLAGSRNVDAAITTDRQPAASQPDSAIDLSEGLDLPDWLKRAAAEQPFDPNRPTAVVANPYGPTGSSSATVEVAPASMGAGSATESSPRPPLSIPDSGPPLTPSGRLADPADGQVGAATATTRAANVADTSSFISEDDLPDWIRQLAAADEAKNVEEMQRAADAAAAGKPTSTAGPRSHRPLPGETAATAPATSPWLTRRERTDVPEPAAVEPWGASAAPAPGSADQSIQQERASVALDASDRGSDRSDGEPEAMPAPTRAASKPNQMRIVLAAAIVLLVVALIAFMALS